MLNGSFCFGRNMDIEFTLGGSVAIAPRGFDLGFGKHLAMIGMAVIKDGMPLFADGMNEAGLCMAALSFPDCVYQESGKVGAIPPFSLIPLVLGSCHNIDEARALLEKTAITDIPFSEDTPNTPLHWHIADKNGALVAEPSAGGLLIHEDPVGVLTNSPPFSFHLTNLRQYLHLTAHYPESSFGAKLEPLGRGYGTMGLPGDLSPTSRYVRAAFLKYNSPPETDEQRNIAQLFHILANVAMPRGSVTTADGRQEVTAYTCCMSGTKYLYRTYYGRCTHNVDLYSTDPDLEELVCIPCAEQI